MVYEPPRDLGADALSPPLSLQGDTKRAAMFPRAGDSQAEVADECSRCLIFDQPLEAWKVLVRRCHLFDPLLQLGCDVVGESKRLDFRVIVQVIKKITIAGLEGAQDRPFCFKGHEDC